MVRRLARNAPTSQINIARNGGKQARLPYLRSEYAAILSYGRIENVFGKSPQDPRRR